METPSFLFSGQSPISRCSAILLVTASPRTHPNTIDDVTAGKPPPLELRGRSPARLEGSSAKYVLVGSSLLCECALENRPDNEAIRIEIWSQTPPRRAPVFGGISPGPVTGQRRLQRGRNRLRFLVSSYSPDLLQNQSMRFMPEAKSALQLIFPFLRVISS